MGLTIYESANRQGFLFLWKEIGSGRIFRHLGKRGIWVVRSKRRRQNNPHFCPCKDTRPPTGAGILQWHRHPGTRAKILRSYWLSAPESTVLQQLYDSGIPAVHGGRQRDGQKGRSGTLLHAFGIREPGGREEKENRFLLRGDEAARGHCAGHA